MKKKLFIFPIALVLALCACSFGGNSNSPGGPSSQGSDEIVSSSSTAPDPQYSSGPSNSQSSSRPSSPSSSSPQPSSSLIPSSSSTGPGGFIDYVHNQAIKLDVDYKGRDFYKDGIGKVTLDTKIDGDTAHFRPVVTTTSGDKIKIRFYGIDTPESTGKIQPYGRAASNFTGEKLVNAKTIVVSTPGAGYKVPQTDSTGSRYLGLVWISETKEDAPFDELLLLNLWIIQAGYSWINNLEKVPEYQDTFLAVENQSKTLKLNLFSGEEDPDFNYGDYETVSILELKREIVASVNDSTHTNKFDNKKVRIVGTVAGIINNTLYLQALYTKDDDPTLQAPEWAGINVYCGMGTIPSRYRKLNAIIMLCGTALDSDTFGFQISGCSFPTLSSKESDSTARVMVAAEDNDEPLQVFNYTRSQLNNVVENKNFESLNCAVKVTDLVTCTNVYVADGGEITLYLNGASTSSTTTFVVYITFQYHPFANDPDQDHIIWKTKEDFTGKSFMVEGVYTFHKFSTGRYSFQVLPRTADNLVYTPA